MTRRKLLYSFFGSTLVYPCYLEPRWLDLTRRSVRLQTPAAGPLRILHLSDLHSSLLVPLSMIDRAITAGLAERPDLIAGLPNQPGGSGDLWSEEVDEAWAFVECAPLQALCAAIKVNKILKYHIKLDDR